MIAREVSDLRVMSLSSHAGKISQVSPNLLSSPPATLEFSSWNEGFAPILRPSSPRNERVRYRDLYPTGPPAKLSARNNLGFPRVVYMRSACKYADCMPTLVQIRNVPSDLHRELKARAALEGMSLSDYLLRELRQALDRPTLDEIRRRLSSRRPVRAHPVPAVAVRAERKSR